VCAETTGVEFPLIPTTAARQATRQPSKTSRLPET
jgi:hypothetical protein